MSTLETIAVMSTLWCVWLTKRQYILSWPVGIIAAVAYGVFFYKINLYADMSLQVVFVLQSIFGWYNWYKPNQTQLPVITLDKNEFILHLFLCFLFSCLIGATLSNTTNSKQPFLDAFASCLSLLANWYLTEKIIQSWYLWIAVDVLLIYIFVSRGFYPSATLYFILLLLSVNGLFSWRRDLKTA